MQHLGLCTRSYLETESRDREQRPTKKSELHRCLLSVSPTHRRQTPTLDTDKSMLRGELRSDFFQPFDSHTGIKTILKSGWFWRIKKPSNEMMFSYRKRQSHVTWKRKNETLTVDKVGRINRPNFDTQPLKKHTWTRRVCAPHSINVFI